MELRALSRCAKSIAGRKNAPNMAMVNIVYSKGSFGDDQNIWLRNLDIGARSEAARAKGLGSLVKNIQKEVQISLRSSSDYWLAHRD